MRPLLHAGEGWIFDNDRRIEHLPGMFIEVAAKHVNELGPVNPGDGRRMHTDQSLAIIMDKGKEVGFLLRIHLRVATGEHQDCVKIIQVFCVVFEFLLVRTSVSVRITVSHKPVFSPSCSMTAMAWETDS